MKVGISSNIDSVLASIEDKTKQIERQLSKALKTSGYDLVDSLKDEHTKGGGRYKKYKRGRGRFHWSSMPGKSPNVDSGFLRRSITLSRYRKRFSVFVVVGEKYAKFLEFGTPRIAARPFIRKVSDIVKVRTKKRVEDAINA